MKLFDAFRKPPAELPVDPRERELEFRARMKAQERAMTKSIEKMEKKKSELLLDAKKYQSKGLAPQLKNAIHAYRMAHKHQNMAEHMLANFKIALQLKDIGAMTKDFFVIMEEVSNEMSNLLPQDTPIKAQASLDKALGSLDNHSQALMDYLNTFDNSISEISDDASGISDAEILRLINTTAAMEEDKLDKLVDEAIKGGSVMDDEIEKKLKDLEPEVKS